MNWLIIALVGFVIFGTAISFGYAFSGNIKSNLKTFIDVPANKNISGEQLSIALLLQDKIENVDVVEIDCKKTNVAVPKKNVIKLSSLAFNSNSVSTLSVAAREATKMIYSKRHKLAFCFFEAISIITSIICAAFVPLAILGAILDVFFNLHIVGIAIGYAALALYGLSVITIFSTLPFEKKLSNLAYQNMMNLEIFSRDEEMSTKRILNSLSLFKLARSLSSSMLIINLMRIDKVIPN